MKNTVQRFSGFSLIMCVCLVLTCSTPAWCADSIVGDWEFMMKRRDREVASQITISQNTDGSYAGTWKTRRGQQELKNVTFENNTLSFDRIRERNGEEFKTSFTGKFENGQLIGSMTSRRGETKITARRASQKKLPILGEWEFKMQRRDREFTTTLTIGQTDSGELTGIWKSRRGENEVSNVKFEDGKLSFERVRERDGEEFKMTFNGMLEGDQLKGTLSMGDEWEFEMSGNRKAANLPAQSGNEAKSLLGVWGVNIQMEEDESFEIQLTVAQKDGKMFARWNSDEFGERKVDAIKMENGQFHLSRREKNEEGEIYETAYVGKIEGGKLVGNVSGPWGEFEAIGIRKADEAPKIAQETKSKEASNTINVVGVWELTSEGRNGQTRTRKLTIHEDMSGSYQGRRNRTTEINKITIDGNQISFSYTVSRNDNQFEMTFKGTIDGETLKGEFVTPRGSREVTGKKLAS